MLCLGVGEPEYRPLSDIPYFCGLCHWDGVPIVTVSLALLPFSMWSLYHLSCRSCSISPHFFRRKLTVCIDVYLVYLWKEASSGFLCLYLGSLLSSPVILKILVMFLFNYESSLFFQHTYSCFIVLTRVYIKIL